MEVQHTDDKDNGDGQLARELPQREASEEQRREDRRCEPHER